jgi:hypothetical protein
MNEWQKHKHSTEVRPLTTNRRPDLNWTTPQRPVRVYSKWGNPSATLGEDGDFALEEITGSLIGPKVDGCWRDELTKVEGPVLGKLGSFPRWSRTPPKTDRPKRIHLQSYFHALLRFLVIRRREHFN